MTDCTAIRCPKPATHTLTIKVVEKDYMPEFTNENKYCLEHVLYFAAWIPYCYPGEYELVSIMPPAAELFSD